jgi:hypothetical protein
LTSGGQTVGSGAAEPCLPLQRRPRWVLLSREVVGERKRLEGGIANTSPYHLSGHLALRFGDCLDASGYSCFRAPDLKSAMMIFFNMYRNQVIGNEFHPPCHCRTRRDQRFA